MIRVIQDYFQKEESQEEAGFNVMGLFVVVKKNKNGGRDLPLWAYSARISRQNWRGHLVQIGQGFSDTSRAQAIQSAFKDVEVREEEAEKNDGT